MAGPGEQAREAARKTATRQHFQKNRTMQIPILASRPLPSSLNPSQKVAPLLQRISQDWKCNLDHVVPSPIVPRSRQPMYASRKEAKPMELDYAKIGEPDRKKLLLSQYSLKLVSSIANYAHLTNYHEEEAVQEMIGKAHKRLRGLGLRNDVRELLPMDVEAARVEMAKRITVYNTTVTKDTGEMTMEEKMERIERKVNRMEGLIKDLKDDFVPAFRKVVDQNDKVRLEHRDLVEKFEALEERVENLEDTA